ncbi:NACHT domain-containing protein [Haliscomenobacter hydrossis]|uniref:(Myosin heavy-chain) kinase n=1 Tax=Haliscomenobacter hydrossis (strain ATCC 27775 / DSM 1100 / LMG 10767 / O) TaxID=760192 RepID=F4L7M0_HALH1|nr:NACHT domain-containing protein [Haliscomenobacter hydrossis]AEE54378.1 (Myosin heavy-chain) kinase [Haliscomenobacter hydrossis DSM 1100]
MSRQRKTRLLLIGIDAYQNWPHLSYPLSDCKGFLEVLKNHYGFSEADLIHEDKRPLYDEEATTEMIYDELYRLKDKDELGASVLSASENLIIYFAGHGHLDKRYEEGYWAPVDAPIPKRPSDLKKLISVGEVAKILSKTPAHHIVLIVDACFPQTFARMSVDVPLGSDDNNPEEKPSRWALTSGRLERVKDKSPFAEALRSLLESNSNPKLSIINLGAGVMERVRESGQQNAWCAPLTENRFDGGEFFFYRQSPAPISVQTPQPGMGAETLPHRMRLGSKQYLERLKAGRFKYLRIEKLLLTETNLPDFVDTQVKVQEQVSPLQKAVQSLWGQTQSHAVVFGDGGTGKTVSLLRLWEAWPDSPTAPVPVFIALNEYNALNEADRSDFVLRSIARNCGLAESLTDEWKNALWNILRRQHPDGSPSILLLLDGFNEVSAERTPLLVELNRLAQEAQGVQMVITSRYVEIRNFQWAQQSEILELQTLPTNKIEGYLNKLGLPLPKDEAMFQLLGNPMMLTIYGGSSQIAQRYASDNRFRFLPTQSVGELLWNFTQAQLVKYYEDNAHDPDEQIWHRFLLRCLLPYIAYRMEEQGDFFLAYRRRSNPDFNFQILLDEAFVELNREELTDVFPEFAGKRTFLGLGEMTDLDAREQRSRRIREYLVEKLTLLVLEKDELRFLHQNFRDFFATCHLLNTAEMGIAAPYWTTRALPVYLRRMLTQIEGEHHYDPQKVLAARLMPGFQAQSRLALLLNQCRGTFHDEPTQTAVMNLVATLADGRQTLAGADLRDLDLQKVRFNGIPLSAQQYYRYLPARLENALLKGRLLFSQGHNRRASSVSYSPHGKKILSGSHDGTVKEWLVLSGECLQTLQGHEDWVNSVSYSPDGKKILSGSNDGTVKEWLMASGECLQTLHGHGYGVWSVSYSPDGKKILSGSHDCTVKEWLVASGECLQTLQGHSDPVMSVSYSADGKKILSGSVDCTVKEWLVVSGECLQTLRGHDNVVSSVSYSADGKKILSGSSDKTVKEWLVASGECLQTLRGHDSGIESVSYSADGKKILSGSSDHTVKEWLVASGECLQTLRGHTYRVESVSYSADGKKILSGSADGTVKEWLVVSGECLQTLQGYDDGVSSVSYSPDGQKILLGSADGTVKEWLVASGECLQTLRGHDNVVSSVSYSADGKKILSGSDDRTVKEWLVLSGECLQTLHGHDGGVSSVSYSPNEQKILSGSDDHTVKEWSVASGECLQTLQGHTYGVESVSYSADGKKILSGSSDKTVKEWLVASGECLQTLRGHTYRVESVSYSADGKKILSGSDDHTVKEWSVASGECLQTLNGHDRQVRSMSYSPDGKKILSGSYDKRVKEWLVSSGECLQTLQGHDSGIESVSYSTDGKKILSVSHDRTVKEWLVESGECLQTLHNEAGLMIQGCDFSHCHPDSVFTQEEKERLRQYGAIFDEKDQAMWEATTAEARSGLEPDKNYISTTT